MWIANDTSYQKPRMNTSKDAFLESPLGTEDDAAASYFLEKDIKYTDNMKQKKTKVGVSSSTDNMKTFIRRNYNLVKNSICLPHQKTENLFFVKTEVQSFGLELVGNSQS